MHREPVPSGPPAGTSPWARGESAARHRNARRLASSSGTVKGLSRQSSTPAFRPARRQRCSSTSPSTRRAPPSSSSARTSPPTPISSARDEVRPRDRQPLWNHPVLTNLTPPRSAPSCSAPTRRSRPPRARSRHCSARRTARSTARYGRPPPSPPRKSGGTASTQLYEDAPIQGGAEHVPVDGELGGEAFRSAIPRSAPEQASGHRADRGHSGGRAVSARYPGASGNAETQRRCGGGHAPQEPLSTAHATPINPAPPADRRAEEDRGT